MSDDAALMAAIHDLPHDDLPRLAYADWLEEHGRPLRAEFIRVELELERPSVAADRLRALRRREIDLIRAHKDEWFGTFRAGWTHYDCRRGFIEEVTSSADAFLPHARWLFDNHAVQRVGLCGGGKQLAEWLAHPLLGVVATTSFQQALAPAWPPDAPVVVQAPLVQRPLTLRLSQGGGAALLGCLARSPQLARLGHLDLSGNQFEPEQVTALLDLVPGWPLLTRLSLAGETMDGSGAAIERLARHPATARLRVVDLSGNRVNERGMRALLESPHLEQLERLTLGPLPRRQHRAWTGLLRGRFGDRVHCRAESPDASP